MVSVSSSCLFPYPDVYTGAWHQGRDNYLFADGYVRLLSIRQTITPEVLWDNVPDWCPHCCDGHVEWVPHWTPDAIRQDLSQLDAERYP